MFTPQAPIGSGFGAASTAADVIKGIDLTGKTAIVTGGYSGIGTETVRALRSAGATVTVPARDLKKAKAALGDMPDVALETLDLLDPASIDSFANRFVARNPSLHILINNAGIMAPPLARDARGYESQFSANHLGHFQLTCRLWPALARAEHARVVALSTGPESPQSISIGTARNEFSSKSSAPSVIWVLHGTSLVRKPSLGSIRGSTDRSLRGRL